MLTTTARLTNDKAVFIRANTVKGQESDTECLNCISKWKNAICKPQDVGSERAWMSSSRTEPVLGQKAKGPIVPKPCGPEAPHLGCESTGGPGADGEALMSSGRIL